MLKINDEWADKVTNENVDRVLELGVFLSMLPADQKPMRMTLIANSLAGEGVARSQEEAYVMLMEAYAHAEVMKIMAWYDLMLAKLDPKTKVKVKKEMES